MSMSWKVSCHLFSISAVSSFIVVVPLVPLHFSSLQFTSRQPQTLVYKHFSFDQLPPTCCFFLYQSLIFCAWYDRISRTLTQRPTSLYPPLIQHDSPDTEYNNEPNEFSGFGAANYSPNIFVDDIFSQIGHLSALVKPYHGQL
ncbi:hypothetical protein DL98DRAFT_170347 [Cadophora sp. DSE1049]|nr:hypothetical protein DL98DRAFT_170347 [Cadophora sp. DSE1049]